MSSYTLKGDWLTISINKPCDKLEDLHLLKLFRSVIFRQMLEPPLFDFDENITIVEGRKMHGAEYRLEQLGILPKM